MSTKVTDLILDMETGDACLEDAYIASAKGKINVSAAIFEAAYKISELPEDGTFAIVQEAAEAGVPNTVEGATKTASAAVAHELSAFFDEVVATAKKVKASAEKDLKGLIALGKKLGVSADPNSSNFEGDFAEPLGKAVVGKGRMDLSDKKFLRSKNTVKIAKGYAKGMAYILSAYGVSIADGFTGGVKSFVGFDGSTRGSVESLKAFESRLSDGGRALSVSADAETDSVKARDITDLAMALYTVANVASAVIDATKGGAKKNADGIINALCSKDCDGKKVSRTCESINSDIKKYAQDLQNIGNAIATGYTNSVYTLMSTVSK